MKVLSKFGEFLKDVWATRFYVKVVAITLIIVMAWADYSAMKNMFMSGEIDMLAREAKLYGALFALCLEGIPTFMGAALSVITDKNKIGYKKNDKTNASVSLVIGGIGIFLAMLLAMGLRGMLIYIRGGFEAFAKGNYDGLPVDMFLTVSPLLTSILAFMASWAALKTENEQVLEAKVTVLLKRYLKRQEAFRRELNSFRDARIALWTTITDHIPMPKKSDVFKDECYKRLRTRLIDNCVLAYPMQIAHYNASVENLLENCIIEMSTKTTIPDAITKINVKEILKEFDENKVKSGEKWDLKKAGGELKAELIDFLDNRIKTAQYKID